LAAVFASHSFSAVAASALPPNKDVVTEFAILNSRLPEGVNEQFRVDLGRALSSQVGWYAEKWPKLPHTAADRAVAALQQIENVTQVLLTAQWPSVPDHLQFIGSDAHHEVQSIMAEWVTNTGPQDSVIFHLQGPVFGPPPCHKGRPKKNKVISLLESPIVSTTRAFVRADQKKAFQKKWDQVGHLVVKFAKPYQCTTSWRIDKASPEQEEFFLACGWPSVQRHVEFVQTPEFLKYNQLSTVSTGIDNKHYRRLDIDIVE